mmetsp:Transcript_38262/g.109265  ORF Transcript_38262/g.109265 Transcript_38262/m.109265 type:complete len:88 (+) Transcript_38262:1423-1686(+)
MCRTTSLIVKQQLLPRAGYHDTEGHTSPLTDTRKFTPASLPFTKNEYQCISLSVWGAHPSSQYACTLTTYQGDRQSDKEPALLSPRY